MEKLFFDTGTKSCVLIPSKQIYCYHCKNEIQEHVVVQRSYSKIMPSKEVFFCHKCIKHNHKRDLDFFSVARIEFEIKSTYSLITEHAPELRRGEIDLFSACELPSDKTEDKTLYSKYESFEGMKKIKHEERTEIVLPYPDVQIETYLKNQRAALPKQLR